jgi:hypothetical protein
LSLLGAALAGLLAFSPQSASALECTSLPSSLSQDPFTSSAFTVSAAQKLYRTQARPWAQIPTGARLTVNAPTGVTEADLHRALQCGAGQNSPLAVEGAKLQVKRSGASYQVQITAGSRSAALEIQRRAAALANR